MCTKHISVTRLSALGCAQGSSDRAVCLGDFVNDREEPVPRHEPTTYQP